MRNRWQAEVTAPALQGGRKARPLGGPGVTEKGHHRRGSQSQHRATEEGHSHRTEASGLSAGDCRHTEDLTSRVMWSGI